MFGENPRMAVVDRIASDLSTCTGKLFRVDPRRGNAVTIMRPLELLAPFLPEPPPLVRLGAGHGDDGTK